MPLCEPMVQQLAHTLPLVSKTRAVHHITGCSTRASVRQTLIVVITRRSFWYCGDTLVVPWPDNTTRFGKHFCLRVRTELTRIRTGKGHLLRALDLINDLYSTASLSKFERVARSCMKPCCHRAASTRGPFQILFAKV